LLKNKIQCKLIQSNVGFDLTNIAELKFFVKTLKKNLVTPKISTEIWEKAKNTLTEKYLQSGCLHLVLDIITAFENNYKDKYLTDFVVFLRESSLEDFVKTEKSIVMVSTIHKAKGREFDHVFMYLNNLSINTDEDKRRLYVGFTRAKRFLNIHYNSNNLDFLQPMSTSFTTDNTEYERPEELIVALTHKDINLKFFKDKKLEILKLMSGQKLDIKGETLYHQNFEIMKFSKAFTEKLSAYQKIGYEPFTAKIRFVLSWFCKDDEKEFAIILPLLNFRRVQLQK